MLKPEGIVFELDGLQVYLGASKDYMYSSSYYWRTEKHLNGVGPFATIQQTINDYTSQRQVDALAEQGVIETPKQTSSVINVNFTTRSRI